MPTYTQDHRLIKITTPLGKDELLLQSFTGEESISSLFRFELQMHSENRRITFDNVIGKKATISVLLDDGSARYINGIFSYFSQGGSSTRFAHYHATLVPWLWMLTRTTDCRIFQNKKVPDIILQIFQEYGFTDFKARLHGDFETRDYCVQYRETDFNFVSRLMEEEGIYYFFEHEADKHTLVLANHTSEFKDCPHQAKARYELSAQEHWLEDVITEWSVEQEVRPGKFSLKDFNFEKPQLDLSASISADGDGKYEIYDFPGEYNKKDAGMSLVGVRMEEEKTPGIVAQGTSLCRSFVPGFKFQLQKHYRQDFNSDYVLTHITHSADQGSDYETAGDALDNLKYENSFRCLPATTAYRPARTTPVPLVHGSQTAIVTGPAGEEIYVDNFGRVKVQFHWDRENKYDKDSSCWVRVSQNWAGARWGAMFIPRIGQEVIVDFLEGNPDQPIITGRVYNGDSMPPYALPDEMTKSTIKSNSSKGGDGFNEIRYEDKKGDEQVFFHAEKDMDIRVKNDRREWIERDRHLIVHRDLREQVDYDKHVLIKQHQYEQIKGDRHETVGGNAKIKVTGTQSVQAANLQEKYSQVHAEEAGQIIHLKAGMMVVIEAGVQLSLKVGGNFIDINPAGVFIQGIMVSINSGGAAGSAPDASPDAPTAPKEAEIADNADPGDKEPTYKQQRAEMSAADAAAADAPRHDPDAEENKEKTAWIDIVLVDEANQPVAGETYRVTLTDGTTIAEGTLNEKGYARVENIDPGNCKVTFPNLDKNAWEPK